MKKNILFALFFVTVLSIYFFTNYVYADSIKCFPGGRLVVYKNIEDINYNGYVFIFTNSRNGNLIISSADCIADIIID
jgi:hypothetical protein